MKLPSPNSTNAKDVTGLALPETREKIWRFSNLQLRLLSAVLLGPLMLLFVGMGGVIYQAVLAAILLIGLYEWLRMAPVRVPLPLGIFAFGSFAALFLLGTYGHYAWATLGMVASSALLLTLMRGRGIDRLWVMSGLPFLTACGLGFLYLRAVPENGMMLVYFLVLTVWATDTGAYFGGRTLGGPRMAPDISPRKTWAGSLCGLISGCAMGLGFAYFFGGKAILPALFLAAIISLASQAGDLFESWLKRRAGIKDSGGLIPGHGGMLDRIDGLVAAAAIYASIVHWSGAGIGW